MSQEEPFYIAPEATPDRRQFYERLYRRNTAPLWEALARLVTPEPAPSTEPALWRFEEIRPLLMEAGGLITAKEAERRVLVLENPGMRGRSQVTGSLYAGVQLVLPGEEAPPHRHAASALRLVLESNGAYTTVDGERTTMEPGDFVLTPSWTWHDHGNPGDEPAIWIDGLDVPIVNLLDTSFAEHDPTGIAATNREERGSSVRFGANMLPLELDAGPLTPPVFSYPYRRSREAIEALRRNGPVDPCHAVCMRYVNPASGGYPMPTIAAFLQLLPKGFRGTPWRSTDATVYCVIEGRGESRIGEGTFLWTKHDVFVVPSWCPVSHASPQGDAVLFSFSDRPVQQALGLWRGQSVPG